MHDNFTYDLSNANTDVLRLEVCKQVATKEIMQYCIADVQELQIQAHKESNITTTVLLLICVLLIAFSIYQLRPK